jgi:hypothetical protein
LGYSPKAGYRWKVSEERLQTLLGDNPKKEKFVKIVKEEIKNIKYI